MTSTDGRTDTHARAERELCALRYEAHAKALAHKPASMRTMGARPCHPDDLA